MAVTLFCYKPSCFSYVNDHVHGLISMRIPRFAYERKICNKTRSPPASLSFKGQGTKNTTVKWPITYYSLRKQPTFRDATTGFAAKWRLSAEIPNWRHVTTQIWVVLLIGRAGWKIWFNQSEALPYLGSDVSSVWNFCARFSEVIWRGSNRWRHEMLAVFLGWPKKTAINILYLTL